MDNFSKTVGKKPGYKIKLKKILIFAVILFVLILSVGFIGYKHFFGMSSVDAFYNTSLTITTVAVAPHERTNSEKMFTAFYALFSALLFLSLISAAVAYIFTLYIEMD